jgi:molybdopterin synthase catalytic subunit
MTSDWLLLTDAPLEFVAVERHLEDEACGGRVVFSGHVRPREGEATIDGLHYEHFPSMAEKQMAALAAEIRERWPVLRLAIHHRVGFVAVGEAAVIIGVACGHRQEAFLAASHAIDRIKEIVPIWKGTDPH